MSIEKKSLISTLKDYQEGQCRQFRTQRQALQRDLEAGRGQFHPRRRQFHPSQRQFPAQGGYFHSSHRQFSAQGRLLPRAPNVNSQRKAVTSTRANIS